jgi:hypothetical protein
MTAPVRPGTMVRVDDYLNLMMIRVLTAGLTPQRCAQLAWHIAELGLHERRVVPGELKEMDFFAGR